VSAPDALRLVGLTAQCEMALVRRDAVAPALLAHAARAAEGLPEGLWLDEAARIARTVDLAADRPEARAARKVAQALVRLAAQTAQAALLDAGRRVAPGAE
jgi:hypothetical protein